MSELSIDRFNLDDAVAILERTPSCLMALLHGLPDIWMYATEGEDTWSPYDVIGHLVHGEKTDWIPRARHILSGNSAPFTPFDRFAQFTESKGKSMNELLTTFAQLRKENLVALRSLGITDEKLGLRGVHPELGEVKLSQLLATWAVHDLDHIAQISRVMAKAYTEETGPWSKYLSILRDRL